MLIRFEVSNFRSIREPIELSMVAVDRDREAARDAPMLGESLLTRAGVYGPNASGKSNLLAAFRWFTWAVRNSLREWDEQIPVDPFLLLEDRSSEFMVEVLVDGVRFEYSVELDENRVLHESLFHYPKKRRRLIFEREDKKLKLQEGLGYLGGARDLLTDRVLVLSIMRRFDEPLISDFFSVLAGIDFVNVSHLHGRKLSIGGPLSSIEYVMKRKEIAYAFLRAADLGISGIELVEHPDGHTHWISESDFKLLHKIGDSSVAMDFDMESQGTRAWFGLMGPFLNSIAKGNLLIIDELDAKLHPVLSAKLLGFFESEEINKKSAQLIFSSHDTSLLNHLNRDEVWLTEKDSEGVTSLNALAEFSGNRVRKSQNLERGYLHGRFGAVPEMDQIDLLRALGLIG